MDAAETQRTSTFRNQQGEKIFLRNRIAAGKPKSIVVIVHGLNSHSGYYDDFAYRLNENGHEAYNLDLPGRGRSDGERFYIADYKDIATTVDQLIGSRRRPIPYYPSFCSGINIMRLSSGTF